MNAHPDSAHHPAQPDFPGSPGPAAAPRQAKPPSTAAAILSGQHVCCEGWETGSGALCGNDAGDGFALMDGRNWRAAAARCPDCARRMAMTTDDPGKRLRQIDDARQFIHELIAIEVLDRHIRILRDGRENHATGVSIIASALEMARAHIRHPL